MGSSEPSLVPEWLKSNGGASGGGRTCHHSASSISHADAASVVKYSRNKSFRSIGESDSPRTHSDRSSSNNLRRISANNILSSKHSYSSFSRNNRDYNKDSEKSRSAFGEILDHDCFDSRRKEALSRSHSMISRKQDFLLQRTVRSEFTNIDRSNHTFWKGIHDTDLINKSMMKADCEREITTIPVNEKQGLPDVARGASPGLNVAVQGLPIGSSAMVGEGWSALAAVSAVVGIENVGSSHGHQLLEVSSASGVSSTCSGLSMAEAPAQSPGTTCTASRAFFESRKLEQIAIKQYKQLVPMIPAMHKLVVPSSADKLKPKMALRNGDLSNTSKIGIQASGSTHLASQSPRGGQIIREPTKASQVGKLYVLRPPWENSTPVHKYDSAMANNLGNKGLDTLATPASSTNSSGNSSSSMAALMERKAAASAQSAPPVIDKKRVFSHARSRNEFFNSVRKKTSLNTSLRTEASSVISVPVEHSNEVVKETAATTLSFDGIENGHLNCIGGVHEANQKSTTNEDYSVSATEVIPGEEEEAEFLRSLGWEEYSSEDGLTEEEINSFYQEVMKLRPTLKLCEAAQHQSKASLLHKLMLVEVHPD